MLSSNTISVLLIAVWLLSSKGLFGKLLSSVVDVLNEILRKLRLYLWCFCFFSCVAENSTSWNYSIIWQSSGPHNSHLTNAESSCRSMREVAPLKSLYVFVVLLLELTQCHARELFIGLQKWEVSCCECFILVRITVFQQFHIKPINNCTNCIIVSI